MEEFNYKDSTAAQKSAENEKIAIKYRFLREKIMLTF